MTIERFRATSGSSGLPAAGLTWQCTFVVVVCASKINAVAVSCRGGHLIEALLLGHYRPKVARVLLGFAPWVVRTQREGNVVGWGGLSIDPEESEWGLEVSYAFAPSAWGQGYATELVQASLAYAFEHLSAPEVHAFAKPDNAASVRVLGKCGFSYLRHEPSLQRDHFLAHAQRAA